VNILFVCTYNVGRSQMAAALYNALAQNGRADSVGTRVEEEGQTLLERTKTVAAATDVLKVMKEENIDISHKRRHGITKEMLDDYDEIVVMADSDTIPEYLHDHPRAVYWDIPDPRFKGIDATRETRDEIKRRVVGLLQTHQN
jgi:arsenate reductase (thioredoxin)